MFLLTTIFKMVTNIISDLPKLKQELLNRAMFDQDSIRQMTDGLFWLIQCV